MPVAAVIAAAAYEYQQNTRILEKMVKDLTPQEWLRHPESCPNNVAWVVGHVVWTRKQLLKRLGAEWPQPWPDSFGRGRRPESDEEYPTAEALLAAWIEIGAWTDAALENVPEQTLAEPVSKPGPPTADGKISGAVNFMAWHETYHLGQISYLRSWLGHTGVMG